MAASYTCQKHAHMHATHLTVSWSHYLLVDCQVWHWVCISNNQSNQHHKIVVYCIYQHVRQKGHSCNCVFGSWIGCAKQQAKHQHTQLLLVSCKAPSCGHAVVAFALVTPALLYIVIMSSVWPQHCLCHLTPLHLTPLHLTPLHLTPCIPACLHVVVYPQMTIYGNNGELRTLQWTLEDGTQHQETGRNLKYGNQTGPPGFSF